ncbi:uncharacterized protein LOC134783932 [Penaeus indicus]|uniref:uncharacterized protein LOC134783932 n=1 Tax=Penaeus indicus TaxID=29960 RepID=UPI00300CE359
MADFVVRSGNKEGPQWCFRPRFLAFLTLLLLVLAHSTSAGVLGRDRTNDTDTQEGRYGHTLNGDEDKHHYTDKYGYGDMHQHDNASLDNIIPAPEAHTDNANFAVLMIILLLFLLPLCLGLCSRLCKYLCSPRKTVIREILIIQRIPARENVPVDDLGAAAPLSGGTEDSTDDAPPASAALVPKASLAPQ